MECYNFEKNIFKSYDIRGVLDEEITRETSYFIGLCLAKYLENKGSVCVGMDARASSRMLLENLIKGLTEGGIDIVNIGLVATPILYFAAKNLNVKASVMVTGSHNDEKYNGFKITSREKSLSGEDLKTFIEMAKNGLSLSSKQGDITQQNLIDDYIKQALQNLNFGNKKLKIGIDAMNGSGGEVLKKIASLLPFDFVLKNCDSSGFFKERTPEPSAPKNIEYSSNLLREESLDFVFSFDGDADRVFLVSKEKVWYGDDITLLLATSILPNFPNGKVIFDVKSSIIMEEEILKLGGKPIIFKTGHSLIKQKMQEEKAILAGEMSGHIYINDGKFFPFDDGIYCFLRLLEILSSEGEIPKFAAKFDTKEIKIKVLEKLKFLNEIKLECLKNNPTRLLEIDGIKAFFHENSSAILARASNTEDVIVVRIEAKNEKNFMFLQNLFSKVYQSKEISSLGEGVSRRGL
jgi:phosphomannomutase